RLGATALKALQSALQRLVLYYTDFRHIFPSLRRGGTSPFRERAMCMALTEPLYLTFRQMSSSSFRWKFEFFVTRRPAQALGLKIRLTSLPLTTTDFTSSLSSASLTSLGLADLKSVG